MLNVHALSLALVFTAMLIAPVTGVSFVYVATGLSITGTMFGITATLLFWYIEAKAPDQNHMIGVKTGFSEYAAFWAAGSVLLALLASYAS